MFKDLPKLYVYNLLNQTFMADSWTGTWNREQFNDTFGNEFQQGQERKVYTILTIAQGFGDYGYLTFYRLWGTLEENNYI